MSLVSDELYEFGGYRLNVTQRALTHAGQAVPLPPKTFELLLLLVRSPGRAFSKQELMTDLWPDMFVEEANLSFQISVLRKALGEGGARWIETIPKYGYRFTAEVRVFSSVDHPNDASGPEARRGAASFRRWHASGPTRWLMAITAASALAVTTYVIASKSRTRARGAAPTATSITAYNGFAFTPSISPNGHKVAFSWGLGGPESNWDIYVKTIGSGEPQRLTTNAARDDAPAWSPDGRSIAFMRSSWGKPEGGTTEDLMMVPSAGGVERRVTTMSVPDHRSLPMRSRGLAWSPDGSWIALGGQPSANDAQGIWLMAVDGKTQRALTNAPSDARDERPAFSPDGTRLAFLRRSPLVRRTSVHVLSLSPNLMASGPPTRVTIEDIILGLSWTPDGRTLVFSSSRNPAIGDPSILQRVSLSRKPDEPIGQPERLAVGQGAMDVTVAASGRLVYSAPFKDAAIWKLPLGSLTDRPIAMPLLSSAFDEQMPDYSPDGKRLTFGSTRSGAQEIWIANADGSGAAQITSIGGGYCWNPRWSPDGQTILFDSDREGSRDLYLLRPDTRELRRLTDDPANEVEPRWSRDGRWIYFGSNRTGRYEVWKMPAGGGGPVQVTQQGGFSATESPDGRFLYYAKRGNPPTSIWRVPMAGGEETAVVDGLSYAANFVVADRGIYFVAVGQSAEHTSIDFVEHGTGARTTIVRLGKLAWYGVALSPDQRTLLYSMLDSFGSNLMLVDGFR
jgi:Tol biopolymer transport system component/DNA-binding winged helix-turn-helix (wHTH) protein